MSGLPEQNGELPGLRLTGIRQLGSQHGYRHLTGSLADGRRVFAKVASPSGAAAVAAFAAEAAGLRWLAAAPGGPPVPAVTGATGDFLAIELLEPLEAASPRAARRLGGDLARMHAAGAPSFGAPWPGFIASLPLDNTPADRARTEPGLPERPRTESGLPEHPRTEPGLPDHAGADWGTWYAERRVLPYLRRARDAGQLSRAETSLVETVTRRIGELAGPAEPPSRIHGDLWSGNVLWHGGRGWLIDPAAHGGHRETDLALLALFGAPHRAEILRGYTETSPLADGWPSRVPLHQLHPLLIHVCLFGGGYVSRLADAARAALAG